MSITTATVGESVQFSDSRALDRAGMTMTKTMAERDM